MLVLMMPTKARDEGYEEQYTNITKIFSLKKRMNSLNHYNLVHKFIPMPQAMKILDAKAVKEWGKSGEKSGVAADESQKQERGDR